MFTAPYAVYDMSMFSSCIYDGLAIFLALPFLKDNLDGNGIQLEPGPKLVHQVAEVGKMHPLWIIGKDDKRGWFGGNLGRIVELETAALVHGRVMTLQGCLQNPVDLAG